MSLISHAPRRVLILLGLTLALLLSILGSCAIRYHSKPKPISQQHLVELDAKAKPFFDDAHRHVPEAVRRLSTGKAFWKLCWYVAKDKVGSGHHTRDYLDGVLKRTITDRCRQGARIYGCDFESTAFLADIQGVHEDDIHIKAYAVSSLVIESLFLKSTIRSIQRVLAVSCARLAAAYGGGALCAVADGPLPIGDAVGAALAIGGTAWSAYDLYKARKRLPVELSSALHQSIDSCREACRKAVLK